MRPTILLSLLLCSALQAQDITGRWVTIDDNTGKRRSVVEITVKEGQATGRIVEIFDKTKMDKTCEACTDDRKGKNVFGMDIIRNMVKDGRGVGRRHHRGPGQWQRSTTANCGWRTAC
jgi:hypothetical protein